MPVGPYPSFEDCVADNQDKDSPEGFCAWLEHETTGKWPGETALQITDEQRVQFEKWAEEKGLEKKNGRWTRVTQKIETRTVAGVEIFSTGVHNGDAYIDEDLDGMIKAFIELKGLVDPPLKIGHTSDEFNQKLAEELGVPASMLTGDEYGQGAMALGWLTRMHREGDTLIGDFTDVPVAVAELIESRSYQKLSAEILWMFDVRGEVYKYVVSAVALLGAELPAVLEIAGVKDAVVFTYTKKPTRTLTFDVGTKESSLEDIEMTIEAVSNVAEAAIKGKVGAPMVKAFLKEITSKLRSMLKPSSKNALELKTQKEEEMKEELIKSLGLAEDASDEVVMTAVTELQTRAKESDSKVELKAMVDKLGLPDDTDEDALLAAIEKLKAKAEELNPDTKAFAHMQAENTTLKKDVADLKRDGRIAHYTSEAEKLTLISGKPDEIAKKLVKLEETDKDAAEDLLKTYQETQTALETAGVNKPKGTPAGGNPDDEHEFMKEVKKYATEQHVDENTAFNEVRKSRDDLYRAYMKQRPIVFAESPTDSRRSED